MYEFLIGNEGKREVPINLGDISYACIGNIGYCNDGFTIAFWIKVDEGYPNIPAQVSFKEWRISLFHNLHEMRFNPCQVRLN